MWKTLCWSPLCFTERWQIYYCHYYHLSLLDCNPQKDPCLVSTCDSTLSAVSYPLKEQQSGEQSTLTEVTSQPVFKCEIWYFLGVCGWASKLIYLWTSVSLFIKNIIHLWDCCRNCRWMRSWPGVPRDCWRVALSSQLQAVLPPCWVCARLPGLCWRKSEKRHELLLSAHRIKQNVKRDG